MKTKNHSKSISQTNYLLCQYACNVQGLLEAPCDSLLLVCDFITGAFKSEPFYTPPITTVYLEIQTHFTTDCLIVSFSRKRPLSETQDPRRLSDLQMKTTIHLMTNWKYFTVTAVYLFPKEESCGNRRRSRLRTIFDPIIRL